MLKDHSRNILFIGHEASISGAPVLLLNLLLLLKQETDWKISLVIRRDGLFTAEYRKHFPVQVLKSADYGREKNSWQKIRNLFCSRWQLFKLFVKVLKTDILFSNTIINGRLLKTLSIIPGKRVISYVHELDNVIAAYLQSGDSENALKFSNRFAYPSSKVKETLQNKYAVPEEQLFRLSYYFPVNMAVIQDTLARKEFIQSFNKQFGIQADFIVGGMGVLCKRKGTDLFIEVCEKVVRHNKRIFFCWIGQFENASIEADLKEQIKQKGLSSNILLTGVLPHHYYNLAAFDLFFLSSREDPYPLVVLEAGFMQVPAMCFENSGGITEFIGQDAGWIIPGFSIDEAAAQILYLYENKSLLAEKGAVACQKSLSLHSDKGLILHQFNELIHRIGGI